MFSCQYFESETFCYTGGKALKDDETLGSLGFKKGEGNKIYFKDLGMLFLSVSYAEFMVLMVNTLYLTLLQFNALFNTFDLFLSSNFFSVVISYD